MYILVCGYANAYPCCKSLENLEITSYQRPWFSLTLMDAFFEIGKVFV